jgi:predicted MFS family arabinose efflux permease
LISDQNIKGLNIFLNVVNKKRQYTNFGIVWTSQATAAVLIFTIPALAPLLVAKFGLSTVQIGELTGIMYVGICGVSVFISVLSDSLGVRKVLFIGHSIEAVSIIGASFAHNFAGLAVCVFGVGVGYSSITPVTSKAILGWFSREQRSSVMGLKQTGTTVGGSIAGAVLPYVGIKYGLSAAFVVAGILVLFGMVFLMGYSESMTRPTSSITTRDFLRQGLSISFRNKNLFWVGGVGFFYATVQSIVVTYITLFAKNVLGFDAIIAGLFLSLVNISGTIGRPVYGAISDRLFGGSRIKDLLLISITSTIMLLLLSFIRPGSSLVEVLPIIALLGFGALGWNGVFLTLAGEYSNPNYEAVGTSFAFSIAMTGQIVGAPIFGLIVEQTSSYDLGWQVFAILLITASVVFSIARRKHEPSSLVK